MTPYEKLDARTDKSRGPGGCWLWTASTIRGYGQIRNGHKTLKAHRVAYERAYGPVPDGMCVCHRCDVPACVNPAHLFLGTYADNNQDRSQKGRTARQRGEAHGMARLTEKQIAEIRSATGTQRDIGLRFGISQSHVSNIRNGHNWVEAA